MKKSDTVTIQLPHVALQGDLVIPERPVGIVLFSHGSGSSRSSPRNRFVAGVLQRDRIATLLFDLLTEQEDAIHETRFDIDLLTERLIEATRWVAGQKTLAGLPIGYFGASTGAASALRAAAKLDDVVEAVVSRGGRPDLAMDALPLVKAPTALIVGALDLPVIEMNRRAYRRLQVDKELRIIPGARHLFEEPGTLEKVAEFASEWFTRHFASVEFNNPMTAPGGA